MNLKAAPRYSMPGILFWGMCRNYLTKRKNDSACRAISVKESSLSSGGALRDRYLEQAISAYLSAMKGFSRNSIAMIGLANVYLECALFNPDPQEQQRFRTNAFTRLADAVECKTFSVTFFFFFGLISIPFCKQATLATSNSSYSASPMYVGQEDG